MEKNEAKEFMEKYLRSETPDAALKKLASLAKLTEEETRKYFKEAVAGFLKKNRQFSEDLILSEIIFGIEPALEPYLQGVGQRYLEDVLCELESEGKIYRIYAPIKRKRSGGLFTDRYKACVWNE